MKILMREKDYEDLFGAIKDNVFLLSVLGWVGLLIVMVCLYGLFLGFISTVLGSYVVCALLYNLLVPPPDEQPHE